MEQIKPTQRPYLRSVAIKNKESGPDSFQWINDWIDEKAGAVVAAIAKAEETQ